MPTLIAYVKRSASGSSGPEMSSHGRLAKRRSFFSDWEHKRMEFFFSPAVKSNAGRRASLREEWDGKNIPFALHFRIVRADVPIGFSLKPGARVTYVGVLANNLRVIVFAPAFAIAAKSVEA